jgi:cytosine/adenosine deaminase-related metal-dependent hydrolase
LEETVLILRGARVAISATEAVRLDLAIESGRIHDCSLHTKGRHVLNLDGFLILPGLINAHDHLDLNLFPRLGSGPYHNATAWAEDIYRPNEPPIDRHLSVPKPVRLLWGCIKNLLSGVTSVAHHNPRHPVLRRSPIHVLTEFGWAHSQRFCSRWRENYRRTPAGVPFVIHAGEGTDEEARSEIARMDAAHALGPSTVLVHGVALDPPTLALLRERGSSLIWCPSSNLFTLGRTLSSQVLRSDLPIALGTDSAITAQGDMLDEISVASRFVDLTRLYKMVTTVPARMLNLPPGAGQIQENGPADLLVIKDEGKSPAAALLSCQPELVFVDGGLRLASADCAEQLSLQNLAPGYPIELVERGRYLVDFDVPSLLKQTADTLGPEIRLAGKAVAA